MMVRVRHPSGLRVAGFRAGLIWLAFQLVGCVSRTALPSPSLPLVSTDDAPFRARGPLERPHEQPGLPVLPAIQSTTLSNGLVVWVVPRPRTSHVALSVVSRAAGTLDALQPGELLLFTARAVVEGGTIWTDGRSVEPPAINGARVAFDVWPSHTRFHLQFVRSALPSGLEILARTVRYPAFGDGELDPVRLSALKAMQSTSSSSSNLLLKVAVDGAFGSALAERMVPIRLAEVRGASLDAIKLCYQEVFRPETSALIAVGDVTLDEVRSLAEQNFGSWARVGFEPVLDPTPASRSDGRRIHLLAQAEADQALAFILQPAPPAGASHDELPFALLAEIAIGSFRSRSNDRLRHDRGLTYGVRPWILRSRRLGLLGVQGAFEVNELSGALREILSTLAELRSGRVSDAELASAKALLSADFDRHAGNNAALAAFVGQVFAEGKDPGWLAALPAAIEAVQVADLQRVANDYLRPDDVEIGVLGGSSLAHELSFLGRLNAYTADTGR